MTNKPVWLPEHLLLCSAQREIPAINRVQASSVPFSPWTLLITVQIAAYQVCGIHPQVIITLHYRSMELLSQICSLFSGGLFFFLILNVEASCCEDQYQLSCPYSFTTQSAPSWQVRNWKIHENGLSNMSSLPIIMFTRFH